MKAFKKAKVFSLLMALAVGFATFGATAGTLAWYASVSRVTTTFIGTSVQKSVQLQIGIVDDINAFTVEDMNRYNLEREYKDENNNYLCDGHSVVWSKSTDLSSVVINKYLKETHHATNILSPITSRSRTASGELDLYSAPDASDPYSQSGASSYNYVEIPFAFKITNNSGIKVADKGIWISDALANGDATHIEDSLRLHINNISDNDQFLVRPNSADDGATTVAGLLNIDGDDKFDFNTSTGKEHLYGEYGDVEPTYGVDTFADDPTFDEDKYYDVNETGQDTDFTTFTAKHHSTCHPITNWDAIKGNFKKAHYYGLNSVKPAIVNGEYTGGRRVSCTNSPCAIGYATLTIYIEGWDHAIIDSASGHGFDLNLTFEINKVV